jgi:hypothetical protein
MHQTPIAARRTPRRDDDLGLVRILAIPMTLGASAITARWGAYLFAIGMVCLGAGLALCLVPDRAPTGRRLRVSLGLIYASAAFVFLQLVTFVLAYPGA